MNFNYYDFLGVHPTANTQEIRKVYFQLSKILHTDKSGGNTTHLQQHLNSAKEILIDDENKRKQYDRELKNKSKGCGGKENNHQEVIHLRAEIFDLQRKYYQSQEESRRRDIELRQVRRENEEQARRHQDEMQAIQHEMQAIQLDRSKKIHCPLCDHIPTSEFWLSGCCGRIFCESCLGDKQHTRCPNSDCWKELCPNQWISNPLFYQSRIAKESRPCVHCGLNVHKLDFSHKNVCVALNQPCFRCNGTGEVPGPFGKPSTCFVCSGEKILHGEWTECFWCSGEAPTFMSCPCFGNRCFKGTWSRCLRCNCKGTVMADQLTTDYRSTATTEGYVLHSITAMPEFCDKSFEELRLESLSLRGQEVTCDVCKGNKKVEGKWVECRYCQGGRVQMLDGSKRICHSCGGRGSISSHAPTALGKPCPFCDAKGCDNCSNTGYVAS